MTKTYLLDTMPGATVTPMTTGQTMPDNGPNADAVGRMAEMYAEWQTGTPYAPANIAPAQPSDVDRYFADRDRQRQIVPQMRTASAQTNWVTVDEQTDVAPYIRLAAIIGGVALLCVVVRAAILSALAWIEAHPGTMAVILGLVALFFVMYFLGGKEQKQPEPPKEPERKTVRVFVEVEV